ncbi:MAG TPA: histidinol-phosphate transaminase [Gammaproteobacteria bacterium]|nr:histidinol-phosphate transaminase [Gammaproteobacteria bacterium]
MADLREHFGALAVEGIRSLQPYAPGKPVAELEREYGVSNIIKLASNENPLGPSAEAIKACQACLDELELYPDGNGFALKQTLAEQYSLDMNRITLGNGSNDILEFIARVFLAPGLNAVFSEHAFAVYPLVSMAAGARLNIARPNTRDHAMPYGHDLAAMRSLVDRDTRVIFIANPNNPTGTWIDADSLEAFIADVPPHVIVVVDEAYVEYVTEEDYPDSIPWLQKYPNLVITRTFSKVHGLAGLRIGYAFSHPEITDLLNRVRQPFNTNAMAQAAALASLGDPDHVKKSIESNSTGMARICRAFDDMGLEYIPSVGNFISFTTALPGDEVYEKLLRQGIIIRPVSNYGLADYLRVTIGSTEQNDRFLHALKVITGSGK